MTVYFSNPGKIDLDVIRLMGVSVKECKSPIGYFGTGLKFAVSTLLRTGHSVKLTVDGTEYPFEAKAAEIRGQKFLRLFMGDEPLPFTTALGRNWEVWQAYRELHSNTLDEGGTITNEPTGGDTVIEVSGPSIDLAFAERKSVFLGSEPIVSNSQIEVHPGESRYVFYRGVRAGVLPETSLYTYNILKQMDISEDRAFKSLWDVEYVLETNFPTLTNKAVAVAILAGSQRWDQNLSFGLCGKPSDEFIEAAREASGNANLNEGARSLLEKHIQTTETFKTIDTLSTEQENTFVQGLVIANHMGAEIAASDIAIAETLGPSVRGLYHQKTDQIYLSALALDLGTDYVAATIFEEWVHKKHKAKDHSREFQDIVLQRFVQVAKEGIAPDISRAA